MVPQRMEQKNSEQKGSVEEIILEKQPGGYHCPQAFSATIREKELIHMMQGDSYNLAVQILNNAGSPVTASDVQDVEITIGRTSKRMSDGQITYENGYWMYPVSQSDSFGLLPGAVPAQVRVVWSNGVVEGKRLDGIRVMESLSKGVL